MSVGMLSSNPGTDLWLVKLSIAFSPL